jgi:hypothetical protein
MTVTNASRTTASTGTGQSHMGLHEEFIRLVRGIGAGTLTIDDVSESGPDDLGTVRSTITGGTQGLRCVHGDLVFHATSVIDPDANGNGTFHGTYAGALPRR